MTQKKGIVTENVFMRKYPGTAIDPSPPKRLRQGSVVAIQDEQIVSGVVWYRVGVNHWVHSGWVKGDEDEQG